MNTTHNPQLPEYVNTSRVQAAKIVEIGAPSDFDPLMWRLALELPDGSNVVQPVHIGYIQQHRPQPGDYFVRDAKGYARHLKADTFDEQFAAVPKPQPISPEQMADMGLLAGQTWNQADMAVLKANAGTPLQINRIVGNSLAPDFGQRVFSTPGLPSVGGGGRLAGMDERLLKPHADVVRHFPNSLTMPAGVRNPDDPKYGGRK